MRKRKILVIDDEIELCEIISTFFTERGYNVISSVTGQGGLDAFESENPDIAMLDLRLNDMSGIEILQKIRETNKHCFVIIITGSTRAEDEERCMALGADYYIQKPFAFEILLKLLSKIVP